MDNQDALSFIDQIVDDALLSNGVPLSFVLANGGKARAKVGEQITGRTPRWNRSEDDLLCAHMGELSYGQIGDLLGRTGTAVKIRATRLQLGGQSHKRGYLTMNKVASLIGCDIHKVSGWVQHGLMEGETAATESAKITLISFEHLKFWLTRPQHWPYFRVDLMRPGYLRDLVVKALERWGDEWLTMRQMADLHGIRDVQAVSRTVMNGTYPGIRCPYIGGRNTASWSFWFVRKSIAERWIRPSKKDPTVQWVSPAAREFMLRMRTQGFNAIEIGRMMKKPGKTVGYLLQKYKKELPKDQADEVFRITAHRGKSVKKRMENS